MKQGLQTAGLASALAAGGISMQGCNSPLGNFALGAIVADELNDQRRSNRESPAAVGNTNYTNDYMSFTEIDRQRGARLSDGWRKEEAGIIILYDEGLRFLGDRGGHVFLPDHYITGFTQYDFLFSRGPSFVVDTKERSFLFDIYTKDGEGYSRKLQRETGKKVVKH